jgi:hypothetical protein
VKPSIRRTRIDTPYRSLACFIVGAARHYVTLRDAGRAPSSGLTAWVQSLDQQADDGAAYGTFSFVRAWQWAVSRSITA